MHDDVLNAWLESSHLAGANATYIEDLYESYLKDPASVSDEWREQFAQLNGGEIWVEPNAQNQTCFRFSVPLGGG